MLVGDGRPDDDYRKFGCDCTQNEDPQAQGYCGEIDSDPELFHCPYPLAEIAARTLRCGLQDGSRCEDGVVTAVHAIYMGARDVAEARTAFDSIAALGGGISRSSDASQIRATLAAALDEILQ